MLLIGDCLFVVFLFRSIWSLVRDLVFSAGYFYPWILLYTSSSPDLCTISENNSLPFLEYLIPLIHCNINLNCLIIFCTAKPEFVRPTDHGEHLTTGWREAIQNAMG